MLRTSLDDWNNNVETVVQWSPFSDEADLLRQVFRGGINLILVCFDISFSLSLIPNVTMSSSYMFVCQLTVVLTPIQFLVQPVEKPRYTGNYIQSLGG